MMTATPEGVCQIKEEIVYDKPIDVGTSMLGLSKLARLEFHYCVVHNILECQYNQLHSLSDSLVY